MANQACRHGHPIEQRYMRPGNHISCRGCEQARQQRYRLVHPDRIKASSKRYYESHIDFMRAKNRTLAAGAYRARASATQRALRMAILQKLGNKCVRCGFSDLRAIQIDHVFGGGSQESRQGYVKMYRKILNNSDGYQLLCANCNAIKRLENNEHPRARKPHLAQFAA